MSLYNDPWTEATKFALDSIDEGELRAQILKWRPDSSFQIDIPSKPEEFISGGTNLHILITFENGERWLARFPIWIQPHSKDEIRSEAATMQALHQAGVAVPAVFNPASDICDRPFFFMEYMEGTPRDPYIEDITDSQLLKLVEGIATAYIATSSIQFTGIGSVTSDHHGNPYVGPICRRIIGPRQYFKSTAARYRAEIDFVLDLLLGDEDHKYPQRVEQAYLSHLEVRRIVNLDKRLEDEGAPTFITHGEPKGDHYMLKEDGTVVGILDWHWSETKTFDEAFGPPQALMDTSIFWGDGSQVPPSDALSKGEMMLVEIFNKMERHDMAAAVQNGKRFERLERCIHQSISLHDLKALQASFGMEVDKEETMESWMEMARKRFAGDAGFKTLSASF